MKHLFTMTIALALPAACGETGPLFEAIRNGNPSIVKTHVTKTDLNTRDQSGRTPLMHAAAFGNLETLRVLLDAGAEVNARNRSDATALLWAAGDPEKARLLIERGADVKVQSRQGRTPLMVAASRAGNSEVIALMLSKGADPRAKDRLGITALSLAARAGDLASVTFLLKAGADPNAGDFLGRTSLAAATVSRNPKVVQLLLQHGADVRVATRRPSPGNNVRVSTNFLKNGPPTGLGITPLHTAAFGPVESVRLLLKAGANVNAQDDRRLAPLSFAVATENPSLLIVRTLIRAGAEVNAPDNFGDTPLDWAEKFGNPQVISELKQSGAKNGNKYEAPHLPQQQAAEPTVALARATELLETSSAAFFNGSGCVSCHHQNLIARAQSAARAAGVSIREATLKEQALQMKAQWIPLQEDFLQAILPGGGANRLAENLLGLKAANHAPDGITDAAVAAMARAQTPDGSWGSGEVQHRPPIGQSVFASTARIIRALQDYSIPARKHEFDRRISQARAWLLKTTPVSTEDYSMRLWGLKQAGASPDEVRKAATSLLALQRADGGWGANPQMNSDAYATGVALTALAESSGVAISPDSYRRGVKFLLSTQFPDGSWHVRSRSIKFQPYFESGFPFGHDQWISTAATAWAVRAISFEAQASGEALSALTSKRPKVKSR
jgi:ankyrin repeat protein